MRFVSKNDFFHYLICGNVIEYQVNFSFYKITTHPLILASENCLIFSKFWRGRRSLQPLHGENTSEILYFFRQNNQAMLSRHQLTVSSEKRNRHSKPGKGKKWKKIKAFSIEGRDLACHFPFFDQKSCAFLVQNNIFIPFQFILKIKNGNK